MYFFLNMKGLMVFKLSGQTKWVEKICFSNYHLKNLQTNQNSGLSNCNISVNIRAMKLIFFIWLSTHWRNSFTESLQVGVVRHDWAYSKLGQVVSQLHLKNKLNCKVGFLDWVLMMLIFFVGIYRNGHLIHSVKVVRFLSFDL